MKADALSRREWKRHWAAPEIRDSSSCARWLGNLLFDPCQRLPWPKPLIVEEEAPSVIEIVLSPAEKTIGRALIRPLEEGSPVPATYQKVAVDSNYSREGVRDAIGRIDAKLAGANMYPSISAGTTPDRVARVLIEQRSLIA